MSAEDIIVRKVAVVWPMPGEIEVTIDIKGIVDKIVWSVATRAYQNAGGATDSFTHISLLGKARLTPETIATRNAYLAPNHVMRDAVIPKFEL